MSIAAYLNMQSAVGHLLTLLGKRQRPVPFGLQNSVNFIYEDDGKTTAIDIRSKVPTAMLSLMADKLRAFSAGGDRFDRFIMVTPYVPNAQELEEYHAAYKDVADVLEWRTVRDFTKLLGLDEKYDLGSPEALETLKNASAAASLRSDDEDSEATPHVEQEDLTRYLDTIREGRSGVDMEYVRMARRLPPAVVRELMRSSKSHEDFFAIGRPSHDVVVVLSDIQNFSPLVKAAAPRDLNDALSRYYREARRLVEEHHGVLDKFMGDSVLAVFNYPQRARESFAQAVRFAANLILLGREIFQDVLRAMDETLDLGTRVGVATGDIWTLNIGIDDMELTFVGDKINLASRLEKNCPKDAILLSNITQRHLAETAPGYHQSLELKKTVLPKTSVKGQESDILSWQVPAAGIARAAKGNGSAADATAQPPTDAPKSAKRRTAAQSAASGTGRARGA